MKRLEEFVAPTSGSGDKGSTRLSALRQASPEALRAEAVGKQVVCRCHCGFSDARSCDYVGDGAPMGCIT